jgi:geranylgeranyl transferase type-1 subunit beta
MDTYADETDTTATCHDAHSFVAMDRDLAMQTDQGQHSFKDRPTSNFELQWIGFNGRSNKIADTCYSWWIAGSLAVRFPSHLQNPALYQ